MPRTLLLLLPLLLAAAAPAQSKKAPRVLGDLLPADRGALESIEQRFGGRLFAFDEPYLSVAPTQSSGIFRLRFNYTGTGWQETFLLGVPEQPLVPAPVLVLFHAFGVSELDCQRNTSLMKLAMRRGWYVVAPRGAHDVTFSIDYAQRNVEYVLDWVLETFTVDPQRFYAVGFSMGGGTAVTYAARHLDPAHARFAAVVDHTGTASIAHAWARESGAVLDILEDPLMFGGPPSQFPFEYARASAFGLDPVTGEVQPTSDLVRNLKSVPLQFWSATYDPIAYLLEQTDALQQWVVGLGGDAARVRVVSNAHTWRTLEERAVLDFLEQQVLNVPGAGTHRLLADRDGRWHHFHVKQDAPGAFTPFRWNHDPAQNRLVVDATQNLERLGVQMASIGLDPTLPLTAILGTQDGQPEELALIGYPAIPSDVRRNGQSTTSWTWDASSGTVTLLESDATLYPAWTVAP